MNRSHLHFSPIAFSTPTLRRCGAALAALLLTWGCHSRDEGPKGSSLGGSGNGAGQGGANGTTATNGNVAGGNATGAGGAEGGIDPAAVDRELAAYETIILKRALGKRLATKDHQHWKDVDYFGALLGTYTAEISSASLFNEATGRFRDLEVDGWASDRCTMTPDTCAAYVTEGTDDRYGTRIDNDANAWKEHLYRTHLMFQAWRHPSSPHYLDPALRRRAESAMNTYVAVAHDPEDQWGFIHTWSDLFESWLIGNAALMGRLEVDQPERFQSSDLDKWVARLPNYFAYSGMVSGANMLWAYKGMVASRFAISDPAKRRAEVLAVIDHLWTGIATVSPKGDQGNIGNFSVDGMLGEHDTLMACTYGHWFLGDLYEATKDFASLPNIGITPEALAALTQVLLHGDLYHLQGRSYDRNLCGRGASVDYSLFNPEWLEMLTGQTPELDAEVARAKQWLTTDGTWPFPERAFKSFYTADFFMQQYPTVTVGLHAAGEHTLGIETFQWKAGDYRSRHVLFPLGSSFIRRNGNEYPASLWKHFDYARVPGITSKHVSAATLDGVWARNSEGELTRYIVGTGDYIGGVEAGKTGAVGWRHGTSIGRDWNRNAGGAKTFHPITVKSSHAVFFLEDAVVHLGAGVDTRGDAAYANIPTYTSLEQRQANAATPLVYGSNDGSTKTVPTDQARSVSGQQFRWAWYGNVAYLLPTDGTKHIELTAHQALDAKGNPVTNRVLSIYNDHGNSDANLAFEWAVLPEVTAEATAKFLPSWRVISNTPALQAITVEQKGWSSAVFYSATSALDLGDVTVRVDQPVVLVAQRKEDELQLWAVDPQHDRHQDGLTVAVTGQLDGAPPRSVSLHLPGGAHHGATATATLKLR